MASLYKNNGIWYVSTFINGTRKTKSLKTKERKTAFAKMRGHFLYITLPPPFLFASWKLG